MTFIAGALAAKRLELLKEVVPRISRVLVLAYPQDPISAPQIESMRTAARSLGVTLVVRDIRTAEDLPAAFEAGVKQHAEGLLTNAESIFSVNSTRVIELAAKHRLPAIYASTTYVANGGLMAFIADFPVLYAGAASYVDKILKGAKPADLPVMQPTKFKFEIDLRAAKALGLTIPEKILFRADKVIE
jgi:putative ABC transport system substrate-binding protein